MFEVDIQRDFSAAHRLSGYEGNCSALHGHNWTVQIFVRTDDIDELGIAVDFRQLRENLDAVLAEMDHADLNSLPAFADCNPTSELLARLIYGKLASQLGDDRLQLSRVRVCESPGTGATYYPG